MSPKNTSPKTLERRAFLASTAATVLGGLEGCTNGTAAPVDTTGVNTGNPPSTDPTSSTSTSSTSETTSGPPVTPTTPGTTPTTPGTTSATSSSSETSSPTSEAVESSSESAATSTQTEVATSSSPVDSSTGGEASTGGGENTGTGEVTCTANTDNGDHSHPLTIPGEDISAGYQEKEYTLEDGGTGHTHTVTLTAYDFLYLGAGSGTTVESSTDSGHSHPCQIACGAGSSGPMCTTSTDNGDHSHPLTIPGEDISAGFQEKTYDLEDGGTGHTHTVTLTAYDFLYLQAGTTTTVDSTMDSGHSHPCVITCTS